MFNLTQQERQVVLFLVSISLVGTGINFLGKKYAPVRALASFSEDIGKVDPNTANKDLLMSLPGIGEKLALRIIEYREQKAGFSDPEELKNIKGISEYKYGKIKDYLIIRQ